MNFKECLDNRTAKKVFIDQIRAKNLLASSKQAIETAKSIPLTETTAKTIFRELYEGLREFIEAIGYLKGYKFLDHLSITFFLKDLLKEPILSEKFDRIRKLRNGINYYGESIELETVKEAEESIPLMIKHLNKHITI